MKERPALLAVSIGCPSGIGPEVSVLAASTSKLSVVLVGDHGVLARAAEARDIDPSRLRLVPRAEDARLLPRGVIAVLQPTRSLREEEAALGDPSRIGGACQLAWVNAACDLVKDGAADALVTGPVSKEAIVRSHAPGSKGFMGHTEHLQRRLAAREVVMAFWTKKLTTALVTTHLPLAKVATAVTPAAVSRATYWLGRFLASVLRPRRTARVTVAGLNPHAGEGGLLGREEATRIAPGIARARRRLDAGGVDANIVGPLPAETAFRVSARGDYDGIVAMYHDQATIPMKLLGFGEAVNVSLGLPIVRTSVDHGTAYDRAPRFEADPRGMTEALALAARMVAGYRRSKA